MGFTVAGFRGGDSGSFSLGFVFFFDLGLLGSLKLRVCVLCLGALGVQVQGLGFGVVQQGLGFRAKLGFRVSGLQMEIELTLLEVVLYEA